MRVACQLVLGTMVEALKVESRHTFSRRNCAQRKYGIATRYRPCRRASASAATLEAKSCAAREQRESKGGVGCRQTRVTMPRFASRVSERARAGKLGLRRNALRCAAVHCGSLARLRDGGDELGQRHVLVRDLLVAEEGRVVGAKRVGLAAAATACVVGCRDERRAARWAVCGR